MSLRDHPDIRALAEERARAARAAWEAAIRRRGGPSFLNDETIATREIGRNEEIEAHLDLLTDLTRPDSFDALVRVLAKRVGLVCGVTALGWMYDPPSPTPRDRDGAPYREDWPCRWLLYVDGDEITFVDTDPDVASGVGEDWYPERWRVAPGAGTTDPAAALLACLEHTEPK